MAKKLIIIGILVTGGVAGVVGLYLLNKCRQQKKEDEVLNELEKEFGQRQAKRLLLLKDDNEIDIDEIDTKLDFDEDGLLK